MITIYIILTFYIILRLFKYDLKYVGIKNKFKDQLVLNIITSILYALVLLKTLFLNDNSFDNLVHKISFSLLYLMSFFFIFIKTKKT